MAARMSIKDLPTMLGNKVAARTTTTRMVRTGRKSKVKIQATRHNRYQVRVKVLLQCRASRCTLRTCDTVRQPRPSRLAMGTCPITRVREHHSHR